MVIARKTITNNLPILKINGMVFFRKFSQITLLLDSNCVENANDENRVSYVIKKGNRERGDDRYVIFIKCYFLTSSMTIIFLKIVSRCHVRCRFHVLFIDDESWISFLFLNYLQLSQILNSKLFIYITKIANLSTILKR